MAQVITRELLDAAYELLQQYPNFSRNYDLYYSHLASFGVSLAMGNEYMTRMHFGQGKTTDPENEVDICRRDILCITDEFHEKYADRSLVELVTALRMAILYLDNGDTKTLNKQEKCQLDLPDQKSNVSKNCPNLSYKFYVGNFDNYKDILANLPNTSPSHPYQSLLDDGNFQHFELEVTYPGLTTGLGILYEHQSENGVKSGFSIDHTSGLPFIQGSNVKGRLRSILTNLASVPEEKQSIPSFVQVDSLESRLKALRVDVSKVDPQAFIEEIFTDKDVFFDAFADKVDCLADDYVTKHSTDGLKNPVPVRFFRMKPGTKLTFLFELTAYEKDGIEVVSPKQKSDLFKGLLKDYGIGAKVNKGYGYLEDVK